MENNLKQTLKKIFSLLLVGVLTLTGLCGCGNIDVTGKYAGWSMSADTLYVVFAAASADPAWQAPIAVTITKENEDLLVEDLSFKGTGVIEEDFLVFTREESVAKSETLREYENQKLQNGSTDKTVDYLIYEDYLIMEDLTLDIDDGELPLTGNGEFDLSGYNYDLEFFEDGDCEFEGETVLGKECYAEGRYTFDGNLIKITFKRCQIEGENTHSGAVDFTLYVKDGEIYSSVYQKTNNQ